jgi:hypothetical protein
VTAEPIAQASDKVAADESRRHFVHIYTVIRVKVAVDAKDHLSAMITADDLVFANGLAVRLTPNADAVLDAEFAEEVTGYLVDEAGDDGFVRSRAYGPDHELEGNEP